MTKLRSASRLLALMSGAFVIPLFLIACNPSTPQSISETGEMSADKEQSTAHVGQATGTASNIRTQKITFRQPGGEPEFSLQFKSSGGKLLDSAGKVIANLILESDGGIKLTDANNNPVGYVIRSENTIQIEGPKRTKTLFSYVQESNGDALLTRNNGSTVYRLKATDAGYDVESDKTALYTVIASKGRGQMQTSEGETVMMTDSEILPSAMAQPLLQSLAIFGFDKLTQAQQAGLAYALSTEAT